LNNVVKFSRPGGKISKGTVKYIGLLPDKREQYLGLELEDEGRFDFEKKIWKYFSFIQYRE